MIGRSSVIGVRPARVLFGSRRIPAPGEDRGSLAGFDGLSNQNRHAGDALIGDLNRCGACPGIAEWSRVSDVDFLAEVGGALQEIQWCSAGLQRQLKQCDDRVRPVGWDTWARLHGSGGRLIHGGNVAASRGDGNTEDDGKH